MMGKPEILLTGGGFPTLYSAHFVEIYLSQHDSITESKHVFIQNGMETKLAEGLKKNQGRGAANPMFPGKLFCNLISSNSLNIWVI